MNPEMWRIPYVFGVGVQYFEPLRCIRLFQGYFLQFPRINQTQPVGLAHNTPCGFHPQSLFNPPYPFVNSIYKDLFGHGYFTIRIIHRKHLDGSHLLGK